MCGKGGYCRLLQSFWSRLTWDLLLPFVVIILLTTNLRSAAATPQEKAVQKLPVIDKEDIRLVRLAIRGQPFNKRVLAIAQDNFGFVWLGTDDGLYRYDGYTLRRYQHDPQNPRSLSENTVLILYKDRTGILWVGTHYRGLNRYDPAQDAFTRYRHDSSDSGSLRDDHVYSIHQDSGGDLWIGTNDGFDRLDVASGRFFHYPRPSDANPRGYAIWGLYGDGQGNLLVGCAMGLYKLERALGRLSPFYSGPMLSDRSDAEDIEWFGQDRSGASWFTSPAGNMFGAVNGKTGEFRRYSIGPEPSRNRRSIRVSRVLEDRNGVVWIGTVRDGLLKLDQERRILVRYATDFNQDVQGQIWALVEDSEGNLWLGGDFGVRRFQTAPPRFVNHQHKPRNPNSLRNNHVLSVHADAQGFLWIGTKGGLHRLNRKTGQIVVYQHDPTDPNSLSENAVSAIKEDGSGGLWVGTRGGGLNRFDRASGRVLRLSVRSQESSKSEQRTW